MDASLSEFPKSDDHEDSKSGRIGWTKEEENKLVQLVELFGKHWKHISEHLPSNFHLIQTVILSKFVSVTLTISALIFRPKSGRLSKTPGSLSWLSSTAIVGNTSKRR